MTPVTNTVPLPRDNVATTAGDFLLRRPALIALAFAAMVVSAFWLHTGLDMYPLDDGWAIFASPQTGHFSWIDFLLSNRRQLRKLPYLAAMALERDGFVTINVILAGIDILTWLGLFVVLYHVFRKKRIEAFVASALIMLFPNDPTMFWLGAFGVNMSYLLVIWSIALACMAIDRNKPLLQLPALLLFFLGVKTYAGFVVLPPIILAYLLLRERPPCPIRTLLRLLIPLAVIVAIAAAPVFLAEPIQRGRDSRVASLDPALILKGFGRMLENLAYGWSGEFFLPSAWMLPYAVCFGLLVATAMWLLAKRRGRIVTSRPGTEAVDVRAAMLFVGMCVAVIVIGYLPFSLSSIRFNPDRALMGARIGYACLLVAAASYAARRLSSRNAMWLVAAAGGALVVLFAVNKLSVFDERYRRSLYQRVFMADLAVAVPCASSRWPLVIHTKPNEFTAQKGGQFLNLRPHFAFRVIYAKNRLQVFTLNPWMLARFAKRVDQDHIRVGRRVVGPGAVIFEYSFKDGLRYLPNLTVNAGRSPDATTLVGGPIPANDCEITPLVNALRRDRPGYLQQLGLTR